MAEPKNIVICCDGTGNEFGSSNEDGSKSNVVKLYSCLKVGKGQVAYYHPGVGTMGSPNRPSRLGQLVSKIKGLAFGAGFQDGIADAYRFLMHEYAPGDRIFLFGFSRGAYTVRALAGVLHVYGLLCPGNEAHLPYLLRDYSRRSRAAFDRAERHLDSATAFKQTFSRAVDIHFAGLWDTVSTIGWVYNPVRVLFAGQNPILRTGRHALSIDEHRCYFQVNPWGDPIQGCASDGSTFTQDIVQAWFPGVHSDVGGSYPQDESAPAIEAFRWILNEAILADLIPEPEKMAAVFGVSSPGLDQIAALYPPPSPFRRLHESLRGAWFLPEVLPHVYFDADGKKRRQFRPWPHRREIPRGALFHPAVLARRQAVGYAPPNVRFDALLPYAQAPQELLQKEGIAGRSALSRFTVYVPSQTRVQAADTVSLAAKAGAAAGAIAAIGWSLLHH